MIEDRDIEKLAELSRIELSPAEREPLRRDIEAILAYVSEIEQVPAGEISATVPYSSLLNVMREDGEPYASGTFSEAILSQAPAREGDYLKVKKIFADR